jgi:hypothetical protein
MNENKKLKPEDVTKVFAMKCGTYDIMTLANKNRRFVINGLLTDELISLVYNNYLEKVNAINDDNKLITISSLKSIVDYKTYTENTPAINLTDEYGGIMKVTFAYFTTRYKNQTWKLQLGI